MLQLERSLPWSDCGVRPCELFRTAAKHPDGMEIDAFVVCNARLSVLNEMSETFFWSTALPKISMKEVDYDVHLARSSGLLLTCKVPEGLDARGFVHEICHRASSRCALGSSSLCGAVPSLVMFVRVWGVGQSRCLFDPTPEQGQDTLPSVRRLVQEQGKQGVCWEAQRKDQ